MKTENVFHSKVKMVLNHLSKNRTITSWEAINLYRATRLSAIIFILKERGHSITTEMKYEDNSRYAIYHYSGKQVI
jgi:hypothetical protein